MICFVTSEIAPGKRGGIGFFVEEAMRMLEGQGMETCVLLVGEEADRRSAEAHMRSQGIAGPAYRLDDLAGDAPSGELPDAAFRSDAYRDSYRLALALERLCRERPVRLVELPDYGGLGFMPLRFRRTLGWFGDCVLAVREHGTAEIVRQCEGRRYGLRADLLLYHMERYAVRHADLLLASTPSALHECAEFHGRTGPGVVSPLPVRRVTPEPLAQRPVRRPPCTVLFAGSLQGQKGPDTLVRAAVSLLEGGLEDVQFELLGRGFTTSARYGSYAEEVERLVPARWRGNFRFRTSYYGADDLLEAAQRCSFAVLPSRWEAFCLVAHELRWLGTPLVLSPLGPFRDCFVDGKDAAFFDGTADGLADVMRALLTGERTLGGRLDVADLYVDGPAFARTYADALGAERSEAAPPSAARRPRVCVVLADDGADGLRRSADSALASDGVEVELLVGSAGSQTAPADARATDLGACGQTRAEVYNAGLGRSTGEFVCFIPAGAELDARYLALAVRALERCPGAAFVTCFRRFGGDGRYELPYGLDPVLVTVEDGASLAGAVLRREVLVRRSLGFGAEMFALEDWGLAWSLAEEGLEGEVLPMVGVTFPAQPGRLGARARCHLVQHMADAHARLVEARPVECLKAHTSGPAQADPRPLTDGAIMRRCSGLHLLRLGARKCAVEGPRALVARLWHKLARRSGRGGGQS